jgi:hypothetical protein
MKPKQRILLLILGLTLPYMAFVMYVVLRLSPGQPLPKWFPYVCLCYFLGFMLLFPFLRKRVLATAPRMSSEEQKTESVKGARAARRLGYILCIAPAFNLLTGAAFRQPLWTTLLGYSWVGFLIWACFNAAKKMELKARQGQADPLRP